MPSDRPRLGDRAVRAALEEPRAHGFLNPGAVLRLHACAARSVAGGDGRRLVGEEDPMLRISRGERADRAPAAEAPVNLSPAVSAQRARYCTQHVLSVWADQLVVFSGHGASRSSNSRKGSNTFLMQST